MKINEFGTVEMTDVEVQQINNWLREDESRMEMSWVEAVKLYMEENGE